MQTTTKFQLSLMMFLEFFIWGGWFVTLGTFLGSNLNANGAQIGQAYSTQSWGAIVAPFIIGLIADRFFNAERILAILHLAGAALMYFMYQSDNFTSFYPLVLAYMILYMPTLALVNSVAFKQMSDPAKEFAHVRLWGTVGWIVAGLVISFLFKWDAPSSIENGFLSKSFLMVAIASLALGVFSMFLPKTPPSSSGEDVKLRDIIGLDALKLLTERNFLVFFISSILICIPLAFYYAQANPFLVELKIPNPTGLMTIGQASEVIMMLMLPFFFKKFGFKMTLVVGMLAWVVRYLLFAFGDADGSMFMLLLGIALHGICYDFFFVSGQIYTDSKAGKEYKSAAQGLITLATYGLGMLVGFWVAGRITDQYLNASGGHDWEKIWTFPAYFAVAVLIFFVLFFKNEKIEYTK
jgi:nucleoside transporter